MSTVILCLFFVTIFVTVIAADEVGDAAAVEQLLSSISSKQPIETETQTSLLTTLKDSWGSSDPKPAWGEKLKKAIKDLPPITPTIENPIQATDWLRFQVQLETFARLNLFEAEDSFAHPASNDYPGEVPKGPNLEKTYNFKIPLERDVEYSTLLDKCPNAERVAQLKQTGKLSCLKYCSSMFYAVPGSKLKIAFTSENIAGFAVRIGHFEDDTSGLDNWRQYPNMRHAKTFTFSPSTNASITEVVLPVMFGGIVYIGQINSSITLDSITFKMSGVVESPSYKFPDMNLLEWREERRVMTAPWGDLISPQLTISYPRRVLVQIEDPEELLIHWERIIDGINEVDATPYKKTREHIGFARDLPENGTQVHAGWPIMGLENVGEDLVEFSQLWVKNSKNMDAIFRALGQNHERHLSLLSLKDGNSLLRELFVDYIKNIVHGVSPHQTVKNEYKAENIVKVLGPYLENGAKFEQLFSSGAATLFYFDVVRNFGWTLINKIANASRFSTLSGEDEKRNALITYVSQFQEENVAEYFKSWGIAVSKEVENEMENLPKCDFTAQQLLEFANKQIKDKKKSVGRGFKKPKSPSTDVKEEDKVLDHDEVPEEIDPFDEAHNYNDTELENLIPIYLDSTQQGRGIKKMKPEDVAKRRALWVRNPDATDLDQLLANVSEVSAKGSNTELVVFGKDAFSILAGKRSTSYVPVVAAAKFGNGRIIAIAGGTVVPENNQLSIKNITDFPYFDQFRLNYMMWAAQYDASKPEAFKPVIARIKGYHWTNGYQEIANFLTETGFPTQQINADKIDLNKYNLVMIPHGHNLRTEFDKGNKLEEFVKNGGGLIFYIKGRDYRNQVQVSNLRLNKLAVRAGISFTDKFASAAAKDKFTVDRTILEITAFHSAGKRLLEMEFTDSKMDTATHALHNGFIYIKRSEFASFPWLNDIKKKFLNLPPLTPMPKAKVPKTSKLMARLRFEDFVMENLLDAEDLYAHPAAKSFPGTIPPKSDLAKVYNATITLDSDSVYDILKKESSCYETENYQKLYISDFAKTSCRRGVWNGQWPCPTQFYAPPGVKISINFTSNAVKSFSVSAGRFIDVSSRKAWERYPLIQFEETFYTDVGEFSSPFGGPLYIGEIVTPISTDKVSYTISGVIESPHFYLGTTRLSDWSKHFSKLTAPWGIVSAENIQIRLPLYALKLIKNPEELMLTWQHMMDGIDEFHTLDYRTKLHILNYDTLLTSPAYMISGKVQAQVKDAKFAVNMDQIWGFVGGGDTPTFGHEFGHNLDPSWWKFKGGAEVTNNVNYQYTIPTVFGRHKNNVSPKDTLSDSRIVSRISNFRKTKLDYRKLMAVAGETFLYDLHSNFGFNVIFKLMRLSKGVSFKKEDFRLDWFFINLSQILKRNMESYLNSWGMKPSKKAVAKFKDYPSTNCSMEDLYRQASERIAARKGINNLKPSLTAMLKEFKKIQDKIDKFSIDDLKRIRKKVDESIKDSFKKRKDGQTVMEKMNTFKSGFHDYSVKTVKSTEKQLTTKLKETKDKLNQLLVEEKRRPPRTEGLEQSDAAVKKIVEEIQKSLAKVEPEIKDRARLGIDSANNKTRDELNGFTSFLKSNEDRGMNETKRYIKEFVGKYYTNTQMNGSALKKFSESVIPPFKKLMQNVEERAATIAKKVHRPVQAKMLLLKDSRNILNQGKKALQEIEEYISPILSGQTVQILKTNLTNEVEAQWADYRRVVQLLSNQFIPDFETQTNKTITAIELEESQLLKEVQELTEKKIKEINAYFEDLKAKSA